MEVNYLEISIGRRQGHSGSCKVVIVLFAASFGIFPLGPPLKVLGSEFLLRFTFPDVRFHVVMHLKKLYLFVEKFAPLGKMKHISIFLQVKNWRADLDTYVKSRYVVLIYRYLHITYMKNFKSEYAPQCST